MENKQTWLANDLVRRLLRISAEMFDREATLTINEHDAKMIFSGYTLQDRIQIVEQGLEEYNGRLARHKNSGGTPHLSAEQTLLSRTRKRLIEKATWYKGWEQVLKRAQKTTAESNLEPNRPSQPQPQAQHVLKAATGGTKSLVIISAVFVDRTLD